ncbi:MAG: peptidylprolyl isomerase [Rudaea sp.]
MVKKLILAAAIAGVAGCSHDGKSSDSVINMTTSGPIAVTVNGIAVPQSLLEGIAHQHNLHLDKPPQREQAMNLTTDMVLIVQKSQHESFASTEQFQADVEASRLRGIADASFAEYQKMTPITDDMLKAEYDAQSAKTGSQVYDFGQLLFNDEGEALKAEGDILAGKAFSVVFDKYRAQAKQAKVFTRVRPDQLPEPMAKAIADLKNGETTKVPVKTEYGWHVVHLDIVNSYTPPPFDQVKEGIRRTLQAKIGQERIKKMRDEAKIEYPAGTAPSAPTVPAVTTPAAAPTIQSPPPTTPSTSPAGEEKPATPKSG